MCRNIWAGIERRKLNYITFYNVYPKDFRVLSLGLWVTEAHISISFTDNLKVFSKWQSFYDNQIDIYMILQYGYRYKRKNFFFLHTDTVSLWSKVIKCTTLLMGRKDVPYISL